MIGGSERTGPGIGVRVTLEEGPWAVTSEIEWTNRTGAQRTLALVGGGLQKQLGPLAHVRAVALCGMDTGEPAYVLPTVGARVGIEWRSRGKGFAAAPSADASIAFLSAIGSRVDAAGRRDGEQAAVFSLLFGWDLPARQ